VGAGIALVVGSVLLHQMALSPVLTAGALAFLSVRVLGIPAMIGVYTCTGFLEGIKRPKRVMAVVLCIVVINVSINFLLIDGKFGLPALGATGAAVGTTVAEWCSLIIFLSLLLKNPEFTPFKLAPFRQSLPIIKTKALELLKFGLPFSFSQGLEMGAFSMLGLMAGRLGTLSSATHEVFWSLNLVGFSMIIGLSSATSVRVGNAIGAKQTNTIGNIVGNSLVLASVAMSLVALPLLIIPVNVMHIFTTSSVVVAMGSGLLPLMAVVLFGDIFQFTLMASLRACNDQWKASLLQILGFWLVLVPLAYYLAFVAQWGLKGLLTGWLVGVLCAASLLGFRFYRVARKLATTPTAPIVGLIPPEPILESCQEP
jgi:MATE family multidrug resistance protein